ncbi:MAG: magnesium/cobalt transporter CorA [Planctomycetota bacterium]
MARLLKKVSKTAGLAPGTLVHVGERRLENVEIHVLDYDETQLTDEELACAEECYEYKDRPTVSWINVDGIHDVEVIEKLGTHFGLHPLVMEDILNTGQRAKVEDYDDYIYLVLKMLTYDEAAEELAAEQVSLILGKGFVISFQEHKGDVFDSVRQRIRTGKGRVRSMGADYLVYTLLDSIVDSYFGVLEKVGERVEYVQEEVTREPGPATLAIIHRLKRELIFLRKSVWPLREAISNLQRQEARLVSEATGVYLRDVYDHTIQVADTVESLRDMVSGMLDTYLSSLSNRMNEVMKVLTIIATIFIPLTFIAGIYGMNFEHMPELKWAWAYPAVWLVMAAVVIFMIAYFRKRRWL